MRRARMAALSSGPADAAPPPETVEVAPGRPARVPVPAWSAVLYVQTHGR